MKFMRIGAKDCGLDKILLALANGGVIQREHMCLNWVCTRPECRMYKTNLYVENPDVLTYEWMGFVPEKRVKLTYQQASRITAKRLVVTYVGGTQRLICSDKDIGGRSKLLHQYPNVEILERLKTELTTKNIKQVTPKPDSKSTGIKFVNRGDEKKQLEKLVTYGFQYDDVADLWRAPDGWDQEDTLRFLKDAFQNVRMSAA